MSYYKAAKHITEFSVNLKNYTFGKKMPCLQGNYQVSDLVKQDTL